MRIFCAAALLTGLCIPASAAVFIYSDLIDNHVFATASYTLTADNTKAFINPTTFFDGSFTQSGLETPDKPNLNVPACVCFLVLPAGGVLDAASYEVDGSFFTTFNRNVTNNASPNKAQTNPDFSAVLDNFTITLAFKDINDNEIKHVAIAIVGTPDFFDGSLDILPFLMDGGVVQNAFETTGVYLRTRIRADDVVFSADLSGYVPATTTNPDRNVTIGYDVKEKLSAISVVQLDIAPEPATCGLFSLALAGLIVIGRKRKTEYNNRSR